MKKQNKKQALESSIRKKVAVGIIGCGNISDIYCSNIFKLFDILELKACSDLILERAKEKADKFNIPKPCTTEELLADKDIELVINLTTPLVHTEVNLMALEAGKHVYVEKPLAINRKDAAKTLKKAKEKGLLVGCAPDTFLGGGIQTCRKIIDEGVIGTPVSASANMVCHGHESWHPDPEFYYKRGGGPMLDMGPYYLTALVNLLGPIKGIMGMTGMGTLERTITSKPKYNTKIKVDTPTHLTGSIDFVSGVIGTIIMSFDIWKSDLPLIEIHGTKGSIKVPDPNNFGGPVKVFTPGNNEWQDYRIVSHSYTANSRGIGAADMAYAIRDNRPHRASGELANHVLDAMLSFEESWNNKKYIKLKSTCKKPTALPEGLTDGTLDT